MKPECDRCGSDNVIKAGSIVRRGQKHQRYKCKDCGRFIIGPVIREEENDKK